MENSAEFFRNDKCKWFPCHGVEDTTDFNCLFCFCPLYHLKECGGNYSYTPNGVKDCSKCLVPHKASNYNKIISKL